MIDYNKVIENDFEKNLYEMKYKQILDYLKVFGETDFFTIVRKVGGSERRMLRLLNEMTKNKIINFNNNKFNIKNEKTKYGKINFDNLSDTLNKIWNEKPIPTLVLDQRPVTKTTTMNRVKYFLDKNDIYGKKIVFLGDDDLTSIALALTGIKCEIYVLDIDKRLIEFINDISKKYKLNINSIEYNALEGISSDLKNKFDCFITDPTPEKIPFTIFMNNGIDLLKKDGIIYTSIYSSAMEENLDLQRVINKMNLYITDIIPNFTEYQTINELFRESDKELLDKYNIKIDDNSICFTESLFRMKLTGDTKKIKMKYKTKDIFGKATKRVLKDKNKDITKNDKYLDEVYNDIKKTSEKKYISK